MKKITLVVLCLFFALPGVLPAATEGDCCETINQIMDQSAEEFRQMSKTIMTEYIKEPETVSIEQCLSAINGINIGFSFSLPSLNDLLKMACNFVKDQIDSQLDEIMGQVGSQYSFEGGFGISGSAGAEMNSSGQTNVEFEVQDTSRQIMDSIEAHWRSIQ